MLSVANPAALEVRCEKPYYITSKCRHGKSSCIAAGCGRCAGCLSRWRGRVRARIAEGSSARSNLRFVTLTLDPEQVSYDAPLADLVSFIMKAWRGFRRNVLWKAGGAYYRVLELTKRGVPHIHLVTDAPFPVAPRFDSLRAWRARLNPAARAMAARLNAYGFGMYSCSLVRNRRAAGAYLGKYLAKDKALRVDGRRVRVAEGSRDWAPRTLVHAFVVAGGSTCRRSGEPHDLDCECNPALASPLRAAGIRKRNRAYWSEQLERPATHRLYARYREAHRAYSRVCARFADQTPERELIKNHVDKSWRRVVQSGYTGTRKSAALIWA